LALWLIAFNDDTQPLQIKTHLPAASQEAISSIQVNTSVDPSIEIIASTPVTHDQLVISPSLEGTDIDGSLKADSSGGLVLDIAVRDFFDYFLSVADELGSENAIAEIERHAHSYLPEPANAQAIELLSNYLRYKRAEFKLQQTPITQTSLSDASALGLIEQSFSALKATRRALFTEQQDRALFGLEDQYANHTLATLRLMADETTSQEQKREQLSVLEKQLPNELAVNAQITQDQKQQQLSIERALRVTNDDSQAHESLVAQGLSEQKASELLAMRHEHQQFERSYQDYSLAKSGLDSNAKDYQRQVSALQKRFFPSPEQQTKAKLNDLQSNTAQ